MKSSKGTFVYLKPHIIMTRNSRRIIVGYKSITTVHFALSLNRPLILLPSELRELADFIEQIQARDAGTQS